MDDQLIRVLIEETVARAIERVRVGVPRPGTVADLYGTKVLVDGDTDPIVIASLGGPLHYGQRVMVLFYPPSGALVLGHTDEDWFTIRNTEEYNLRAGGVDHYTVAANSLLGWVNEDGSLFLGKNLLANYDTNDPGRMHPDFLWDARGLRLFVQNITMSMIADPVDINLRRFGPDMGGFPYAIPGGGDGTFEDLTGLGVGALVGQVRATPALVPYGGDQDTPGGRPEQSGAVISFICQDMPRYVTEDQQPSVGMNFEINLAPDNGDDFRNTTFRSRGNGSTQIGIGSCETSDTGALLQVRAHPGLNNSQVITIEGSPTGGTFKLNYFPPPATDDGFSVPETTGNINYNATAGAVQTTLEALASIGAGNVSCTSGPLPGTAVTVEFVGDLAGAVQYRMAVDPIGATPDGDLTGGTDPRILITRVAQNGINHELDRRLLDLQHATGHTEDYIRIRDGDDSNALTLAADKRLTIGGDLDHDGSRLGFYNRPLVTRATVTGSRGGNAALASLLTILANTGLIIDNST